MGSLRLADLLASVSLVADLGFALPADTSIRSAVIAASLARRLGLSEAEASDAYYTSLLEHIGCTGFAHEAAAVYGDEMALNVAIARTDPNHARDVLANLIRPLIRGRGPIEAARLVAFTLVRGDGFGRRFASSVCEVGRATAQRMGLSDGVQEALADVVEAWDGRSGARGLKGDAIAPAARIAAVATTVAQYHEIGGLDAVEAALRQRSGGLLDPRIVDAYLELAPETLAELDAGDAWRLVLDAEPVPFRVVDEARLPAIAGAVADVVDLKSPYTLGHSSAVATLAGEALRRISGEAEARNVAVAGLLHDIGRVGISDATWERRGPLTTAQWEQVRLHPYHSERILGRSDALRPVAAIAGMHHERIDGTGYHRGSRARDIPLEARVLAAADAFQAMTEDRPHRPGHSLDGAATTLTEEASAGRLDRDSVQAVLAAAGVTVTPRTRSPRPAGLTDREVEVLRLVARGLSNREIASALVVSPRTAEHHVQHIYTKVGVSSRAAVALFAMEHDLLR
jgi:HD-GYP domain-containing protein (c-di-GMP phosphodiesterase class II)